MANPARRRTYPEHQYADNHALLRAYQTSKPVPVRLAKKLRGSGEVACERIRELAWDIGADKEWYLWMADVSRKLGINYSTARAICQGKQFTVSTRTVDKIAIRTGIPPRLFYDPEL